MNPKIIPILLMKYHLGIFTPGFKNFGSKNMLDIPNFNNHLGFLTLFQNLILDIRQYQVYKATYPGIIFREIAIDQI